MKRILLLVSLFTFPLYAFGDFVPGRIRASAHADLAKLQGDGRYQNVAGAHAVQLQTDGKGITGFQVSLDQSPDVPFAVRAVQPNRCGRTFVAQSGTTRLQIDELSADECREGGQLTWHVTLTTDEGGGRASHLQLHGSAEYLMLTQ